MQTDPPDGPAATIPAHAAITLDVDGVQLLVRDWGPHDGQPVIFHHGTPSNSLSVPGGWESIGTTDARIITFDRPGYGSSDRQPGRTVSVAATWTAAIADALHLDRVAVMGTSGGGPHAAAAAAVLGDRITRLCVSVGLGPAELTGFDVMAGMLRETADELAAARRGEPALRAFIDALMNEDDPLEVWMSQLPPSDVEILGRAEVRREEAVEGEGLASGVDGWLDDDLAFVAREWGCDLTAITALTLLVYGDADVIVPHQHGDAYLRAIGHGQLMKIPAGGHWMRDVEPAMLTWLAAVDAQAWQPGSAAR